MPFQILRAQQLHNGKKGIAAKFRKTAGTDRVIPFPAGFGCQAGKAAFHIMDFPNDPAPDKGQQIQKPGAIRGFNAFHQNNS